MRSSGVKLAAFASAHDANRIYHCCRPVEALSKGVAHEGPRRCVVSTDPSVYVVEELDPFLGADTALQDSGDAALVKLAVD